MSSRIPPVPAVEFWIGLPVFNGERQIERSIRSVLAQTFKDFRLVVVDDGSTDKTCDIVQFYADQDSRIHLERRSRRGASVQRNWILNQFDGAYLVWLDCGDELDPSFFQERLAFLKAEQGIFQQEKAAIVGDFYRRGDGALKRHRALFEPDWIDGKRTLEKLLTFTGDTYFHAGGTLTRAAVESIRNEIGDLYPADMKNGPDYIAVARMASIGIPFFFQEQPLVTIVSEDQTSEQGDIKHKLIARFDDFCRGADNFEPLFAEDKVFCANALACHYYRRYLALQKIETDSQERDHCAARALAKAVGYNAHAKDLYEVLSIAPHMGARCRLLKTFDTSASDITIVHYQGTDIALSKTTRILRRLLTHHEYENVKLAYLRRKINQHQITHLIDAGASAGVYPAVLGSKCSSLEEIHAFEPTPKHFELLNRTIGLLAKEITTRIKIQTHQEALSSLDDSGTVELLVSSGFGGANRLVKTVNPDAMPEQKTGILLPELHGEKDQVLFDEIISVPCRALDDLLSLKGKKIAIKIDIEGNELKALAGMDTLLAQNECVLQIEAAPRHKMTVVQYMKERGYSYTKRLQNDLFFEKESLGSVEKKKTLYLHAGPIRTGTTSLQMFLWENKKTLEDLDIHYAIKQPAHQKVKSCLTDEPEEWARFGLFSREEADLYLSEVVASINQNPANTLFLTHENFFQIYDIELPDCRWFTAINTKRLRDFVQRIDRQVKIILYLRRQDLLIASAYGMYHDLIQNMPSFSNWIKPSLNWKEHLDAMRDVFGEENLIIRVHEKGQLLNESVLDDFLNIWGLVPDDGFALPAERHNVTPPRCVIELVNQLGPTFATFESYSEFRKKFYAYIHRFKFCKERFLTKSEAQEICDLYKESNASVARTYLGREDGLLFKDGPEDRVTEGAGMRAMDVNGLFLRSLWERISEEKQG